MLDGLDAIDWSALKDAYGPATPVPEAIRGLLDDDEDVRDESRQHLWMGLCYQGVSLAEASAHALPFLLRLALDPEVSERALVLEIVQGMAEVAMRPPPDDDPDGGERAHCAAVRKVLEGERALLRGALDDADPDVRARAALTLAELARVSGEPLADTLSGKLRTEPEPATRVAFVAALAELSAHDALRLALSDSALAVRLFAALNLLAHDATSERSWDIVRAALQDREASEQAFAIATDYRSLDWVRRICAAGRERARVLLSELLALLFDSSPYRASDDLAPLLATFFAEGVPETPDLEQSAIVATVARHRAYFGTIANAQAVLRRHGFPERPRPLRAYAARGPSEHRALVPQRPRRPAQEALREALEENFEARLGGASAVTQLELFEADDALIAELHKLPLLKNLRVTSADLSPRGFALLARLRHLTFLTLEDLTLDEECFAALSGAKVLERLWLYDVSLDDAGLRALAALPSLTFLCLQDCAVTGRAFAAFRKSRLSALMLRCQVPLTGEGLGFVAELPLLRALSLHEVALDDTELRIVARCAGLERLELYKMDLGAPLALPTGLVELDLEGARLSPQALERLAECASLRRVSLVGVKLCQAHVDALARATQVRELRVTREHLAAVDARALRMRDNLDLHAI